MLAGTNLVDNSVVTLSPDDKQMAFLRLGAGGDITFVLKIGPLIPWPQRLVNISIVPRASRATEESARPVQSRARLLCGLPEPCCW